MHNVILDASARAAFVSAWASAEQEAGRSHGGDLMDAAPATNAEAKQWAKALWSQICAKTGKGVEELWAKAAEKSDLAFDDTEEAEQFGHYVAMQAMGEGVAWTDSHNALGFKVPSVEGIMVDVENAEADEPAEDDLITNDHSRFYQNGKHVLTTSPSASNTEMWNAIESHMAAHNFYPNVWFISDHGNSHLMSKPQEIVSQKLSPHPALRTIKATRENGRSTRVSNAQASAIMSAAGLEPRLGAHRIDVGESSLFNMTGGKWALEGPSEDVAKWLARSNPRTNSGYGDDEEEGAGGHYYENPARKNSGYGDDEDEGAGGHYYENPGDLRKTHVQTLIFSKACFTAKQATSWAKKHGYTATKLDEKLSTLRARQASPTAFVKTSFKTISLTDGVQAVVGVLKK